LVWLHTRASVGFNEALCVRNSLIITMPGWFAQILNGPRGGQLGNVLLRATCVAFPFAPAVARRDCTLSPFSEGGAQSNLERTLNLKSEIRVDRWLAPLLHG